MKVPCVRNIRTFCKLPSCLVICGHSNPPINVLHIQKNWQMRMPDVFKGDFFFFFFCLNYAQRTSGLWKDNCLLRCSYSAKLKEPFWLWSEVHLLLCYSFSTVKPNRSFPLKRRSQAIVILEFSVCVLSTTREIQTGGFCRFISCCIIDDSNSKTHLPLRRQTYTLGRYVGSHSVWKEGTHIITDVYISNSYKNS